MGPGPYGRYLFSLKSPNIVFSFYGDSLDDVTFHKVEIFNTNYQLKNMQIIGVSEEIIQKINGIRLNRDNNYTLFADDGNGLIIRINDGIVISYMIIGPI